MLTAANRIDLNFFGDVILQVHAVGAHVSYGPARGDRGLEIAVGVGNGHGRTIEQIQTQGDNNWAKAVLVRIGAVGVGHPALRFGVNALVDRIAPEDATVRPLLPDLPILEVVTGVYLALRGERLQLELAAGTFEHVSDYRAELNWSFGR